MKSYPSLPTSILAPELSRARISPEVFPGLKSIDRAVHETILHRAYAIWEREGHPNHCQLSHWLRAEAEVMRS